VFCTGAQSEDFDQEDKKPYVGGTIGILRHPVASRQHGDWSSRMQKDEWSEKAMEQTTQVVERKSNPGSRRNQIRFPLRTPVVYRWQDGSGLRRHARGWTRDISEAGAYVLSNRCPIKGEFVELTFKLLGFSGQHDSSNKEHLAIGGEVVRVDFAEMAGAAVGFAVRSKTAAPNRQTVDPPERIWMDRLALSGVCN
jgi:hypothetical protein